MVLTEKKERTDEFNHKKGKHQEHFRCLNCWLVSTKTDLSRVPFFGKKKATLLFQFPAVFEVGWNSRFFCDCVKF